jgi:hypothetical protein
MYALKHRSYIKEGYARSMSTYVNICFEIPDKGECDTMFDYLTEHPKDVWDYEKRVEQSFHDRPHTCCTTPSSEPS